MRIFKLKQEVITRATRQNKQITLPRVLEVVDLGDAYSVSPLAIDIPKDDWEAHGWAKIIGEMYDEEMSNG